MGARFVPDSIPNASYGLSHLILTMCKEVHLFITLILQKKKQRWDNLSKWNKGPQIRHSQFDAKPKSLIAPPSSFPSLKEAESSL